jgi:hypothetical protein
VPRRLCGQRVEVADQQRQREAAQRVRSASVRRIAARRRLRRPLFPHRQLAREIACESVEPALPAHATADHRGVDEQLLPAPRRAQHAARDGLRVGILDPAEVRLGLRVTHFGERVGHRRLHQLFIGRDPAISVRRRGGRRAGGARVGHFAEREVFREATRREPLGGARDEREEGAAAGVRSHRAARELRRHAGARERLVEVRVVLVRRAQQHRDAVEVHTFRGELQAAPRDLDALATLARRRQHDDALVWRGRVRRGAAKEVRLQARARSRRPALQRFDRGAENPPSAVGSRRRRPAPSRAGRARARRARRRESRSAAPRARRRAAASADRAARAAGSRASAVAMRKISARSAARVCQLGLVGVGERDQIGRRRGERVTPDARHAQLREGARHRARETWSVGHRPSGRAHRARSVQHARRERLRRESAERREAA